MNDFIAFAPSQDTRLAPCPWNPWIFRSWDVQHLEARGLLTGGQWTRAGKLGPPLGPWDGTLLN